MGGETGRLHNALVEKQKIALGVTHSCYDGNGRDFGSAGLYGRPVPGVATADMEAAFDAEIARLLKDGVTETEVADAKRRLAASAIFARDSLDGPARILGGAVANGQRIEDVEDWPERIAADRQGRHRRRRPRALQHQLVSYRHSAARAERRGAVMIRLKTLAARRRCCLLLRH